MGDGAVERKKAKGGTKKDQSPPPFPLPLFHILFIFVSFSSSSSLCPSSLP